MTSDVFPAGFCGECRKAMEHEQKAWQTCRPHGPIFCSEECVEQFYGAIGQYLADRETDIRQGKECQAISSDVFEHFLEETLQRPKELYLHSLEGGETIGLYVGDYADDYGPFYMLGFSLFTQGQATFLLHITTVRDESLLPALKIGDEVPDLSAFLASHQDGADGPELDEETMVELEQKKSSELANLIMLSDGPALTWPEVSAGDHWEQETLESPDVVYEVIDNTGDKLLIFIKAIELNGEGNFSYVISWPVEGESEEDFVLLPVLAFPSKGTKVFQHYSQGKIVSGHVPS